MKIQYRTMYRLIMGLLTATAAMMQLYDDEQ